MAGIKSSKPAPRFSTPLALILLGLWSAGAVWLFYQQGWLLYYGDAEAHLNIARRIVDSRTPGPAQIGTVWLPLPHLMMAPLVRHDQFWHSGLAGAIPSAACFIIAGAFLFAAARRIFGSVAAAAAAAAMFALNPNALYVGSIPMTESAFFASLTGLLYFSVLFRDRQSWIAVIGAGVSACAGTLARYEAWFLLPFLTLYFFLIARQRRVAVAATFAILAGLGPLSWLAHNYWYFRDPLYFARGPGSARDIQGTLPYPGRNNWREAFLYLRTAAQVCAGMPLAWMALAGGVIALVRRAIWPVLLLALPGVFYVWSIHSSGTPIFLPSLPPHAYYNSRYGLSVLPLLAFAAAALVTIAPLRWRRWAAVAVIVAACSTWLAHPSPEAWITWKEAQVNSDARREWTRRGAEFLRTNYHRGDGIITSFGDLMGIFRSAGIPIRETLTGDNGLAWNAAVARPDLFLHEEWAAVTGGDTVQTAVNRARRRNFNYDLVETIVVKGAPVVEIYRRNLVP